MDNKTKMMKYRRYKRSTFDKKHKKQELHKQLAGQISFGMETAGHIVSLTGETLDVHWEWAEPLLGSRGRMYAVERNPESAKIMSEIATGIDSRQLHVIEADVWDVLLDRTLFSKTNPLQIIDLDMCCAAKTLIELGFEEKLTKLIQSGNLRKSGTALMITLCQRTGRGGSSGTQEANVIPAMVRKAFAKAGWIPTKQSVESYKEGRAGSPMWQYLGIFKMNVKDWRKD
jgi:hypothetical protein